MNERQVITQIMEEYGLTGVYRTHTLHGNYPLLDVQGVLSLDRLIDTPHFARAAREIGTIAHLWSGEHVRVTTAEPGAIHVDASAPELEVLTRQHLTNAARDLQRHYSMADELEEPAPENIPFSAPEADFLFALGLPPVENLRDLSREERLDRARALRGQTVMDTHEVREFEDREAMQEYALLHFPPVEEGGVEEEPPLSEEDVVDLARRERLLRLESGYDEGNDWH
ncbi:hypothetical protein QOL99_01685 [Deinococcus sp. MIMF12]|uniref:Uncharacterized protein n=1 Tax=Deinococcus rhizophilus TaxID=3049544 RepID=A0ABT7JCU7_9DEIO|nr:hypothetical protein [Deinococcus rhizophilus]MDL2342852.1 hypothetical protein [Deinococcus rhizophilus]